jgi:hypothetical protein
MDITLVNYMQEQLEAVSLRFKRYMYGVLPWEARMVGLTGPRGIGKSTLMLQRIKEMDASARGRSFYMSADHSYFATHTLIEAAGQFVREGVNGCLSTRCISTRDGRRNSSKSMMPTLISISSLRDPLSWIYGRARLT